MVSYLSHPAFQVIGLPLLFVLIGVYANKLSRRDGDKNPAVNDWAIANTMLILSLGTVAADFRLVTSPKEATAFLFWMIGFLLLLFVCMDHDRYRSWKKDEEGQFTNVRHTFIGVILPDAIAFVTFSAYQLDKVV